MSEDEHCTFILDGGRRSCRATPVVADYVTGRHLGLDGKMRFPLCEEHTKPEYHPPGLQLEGRHR